MFAADELFSEGFFLDNPVGRDLRGHLRRVGISFRVHEYCKRGDLPFTAEMKPMPRGHWHWLEIRATGVLAHVCRTDDLFKFPEEAESRQDLRLTIQPDLLSWANRDKSLAEIIKEVPVLYGWLMFRVNDDGQFSHLCWGSPAVDCDEWVAHINILREINRAGEPLPVAPIPDPKDRIRLKDHVRRSFEETKKKPSSNKA